MEVEGLQTRAPRQKVTVQVVVRYALAAVGYLALSWLVGMVGRTPLVESGEVTLRPEVALAVIAFLVFGWGIAPVVFVALAVESTRTPIAGASTAYDVFDSVFALVVSATTAFCIKNYSTRGRWGQHGDFVIFWVCVGFLPLALAGLQIAFLRSHSPTSPILIAWMAVVFPMVGIIPAGIKLIEWFGAEPRQNLLRYLGQGVRPAIQVAQLGLIVLATAFLYFERVSGANGRIYPLFLAIFWIALTAGLPAASVGLLLAESLFVAVNRITTTESPLFDQHLAAVAMGSTAVIAGGLVSARKEFESKLRTQSEVMQRRLAELQVIRRLADSIIALRDEGALFELGAELIGEQMRADQVWLLWIPYGGIAAEERGYWSASAQTSRDRFSPDLFSAALTPIWLDLEQSRREIHSSANKPDSKLVSLNLDVSMHQACGIKSLILHPFSFEKSGFYVAAILTYHRYHRWSADELQFFTAIADQITIALQKTKLLGEREERSRSFARMTQALVADTGDSFFRNLVLRLSEAAGSRGAYCSRLDASGEEATMLAFADSGRLRDEFKIPVKGNPIDVSLSEGWEAIEDNAGDHYPQFRQAISGEFRGFASTALLDSQGNKLGTLAIYDDKPLVDSAHIISILRLFSARASAEIERTERELVIRESETSYRRLLETAHEGIWIVDSDGKTNYVNATMASLLGYSAEEVLGRRIQEFVDVQDRERVSLELQRELAGAAAQQDLRFSRRDGSFVWTMLSMSPIRNQEGAFNGALAMVTDISERKRTEEELDSLVHKRTAELLTSNRELEAFCYSISHDLRQPLRAIDGFSRAVVEDLGEQIPDGVKDHLMRVRRAANRMSDLIDALLALSRLSRVDMKREKVDLSQIAENIVADLVRNDPARAESYSIRKKMTATGDARLLHIVLENLLSNAWKFSSRSAKPFVEFGMQTVKGQSRFYVRDNGIGFDMAYSGKLFKPFERLHSDSEFYGTGIGLATASRIVNRHGGQIWADGTVGGGATFYFTLDSDGGEERPEKAYEPLLG